ncbi:MAG: hypothetical protein ACE5EM_00080 [Sphingomonadales bacterium]
MKAAGEEVFECQRVLGKTSSNAVAELLAGQGMFYEHNHYPKGDVYDQDTHSQYYYHAHRGMNGEHGHLHTFLRGKGMPADIKPAAIDTVSERPLGDEALSHLIGISMDAHGLPMGMFTTNRWVTDETWYAAEDVVRMVDIFLVDHTFPNWAVNRWLNALFRLFKPQIQQLIRERDERIAQWQEAHPDRDAFEDRDLEIVSTTPISVVDQFARIIKALRKLDDHAPD